MRATCFFSFVLLLFLCLDAHHVVAQAKNKPGLGLAIAKTTGSVVLDGKLDEDTWKQAAVAKNFYMNYPVDSLPPTFQSEARMTFDDHFMYVSFVCYDDAKPNIVQSLSHVENQFPADARANIQALVLKFTYWLNL